MSEEQPVPSLCQTPELFLHPEQMLRMGLGLVLSDLQGQWLSKCWNSLGAGYVCFHKCGGPLPPCASQVP